MNPVWLVARREIVTRARERGFHISSGIMIVIVLAVVLVPRVINQGGASFEVALTGDGSARTAPALAAAAQARGVEVHTRSYPDPAAARSAVRDGDADAALVDGDTVAFDTELDPVLSGLLERAHRAVALRDGLRAVGVDPDRATRALDTPPLRRTALDDADSGLRRGIAFAGVIILFGQLIGYGNWVATGVIEEKSSRVVELLLAALRPWQLLAGKILGIGVLALGQLAVVSGAGLVALLAGGTTSLPAGTLGIVGQVFAWFVLGYAFFASAYAAAASLVSRQEELNNVTGPMTLVLMVNYFVAVYTTQNPKGTFAEVASLVPPFSAMTMPSRTAAGQATGWQIVLAVGLMLLVTVALVRLSGRIYRNAIARTGARVRLTDAFRGEREPTVV